MKLSRMTKEAEILQESLEVLQDPDESLDSVLARCPQQAEDLRPSLEAGLWLREQGEAFAPRPGFVAASRKRLVGRIRQERAAGGIRTSRKRMGWRSVRGGWLKPALQLSLALVLVAALFVNGVRIAKASPTYLPGDALYPVKTGLESAKLIVTPGTAAEANLHIDFARQRLMEIQGLAFEGSFEEVPASVDSLDEHVTRAVLAIGGVAQYDPLLAQGLALELQEALSRQTTLVLLLSGMVPPETRLEFERVQAISQAGISAVEYLLLS